MLAKRSGTAGKITALTFFMIVFLLLSGLRAHAAVGPVEKLKVTQTGERYIELSWKRTPGASGYLIRVRNTSTDTFKTFRLEGNKSSGGIVTYKLTGCRYCTRYRIQVAAYKGKETGDFCRRVIAQTKLITPAVPEVTVTSVDVSGVGVYWKKVPYATHYEIYKTCNGKRTWVGKTTKHKIWLKGLKAGTPVTISIRAVREKDGNKVRSDYGSAECVPLDREAGLKLASSVDDRDVYYYGSGDPYHVYSKDQAEAYVNYRNGGGAFNSRTNYFVWVNSRTYRVYIFRRSSITGKQWELAASWPCIIGMPWTPTSRGNYTLHRAYEIHYYSVNYAKYCTSYAGMNMFHTLLYPQQSDYLPAGYMASQGCIRVCMAGAKYIYEYCNGASMIVR